MKAKYCITKGFKILIAQFILSFIGFAVGCKWGLNIENNKWSHLIYNDIKIADIDIGGKTKEEARSIIKSKYIDAVINKKLYVTVDDKIYSEYNSNLIKGNDMDNVIDEAFNFGKDLNAFEKHRLIRMGSKKTFSLNFNCDYEIVNAFTKNIEKEVNKEPVNASIAMKTEGAIKIDAEINGYKLEKEKLDKYISDKINTSANMNIHIDAPVQKIDASVTQTKLSLINSCIASFSTSFQSSSYMRSNNIDISVKAINGRLLFPGETFSFNDMLGERTKERGYMEAPVIINNKVESGIGGGICQVSSTLYNAILKSGIQDIRRTNHSLPSSYVELGLDATVDWQNIDFKFINTLDYPMYIEMYTKSKNLYINIYSNSDLNKRKYIIENDVNEYNNTYNVKVTRKTYESGNLINSELISDDIYTLGSPVLKKRF